MQLILLVNIILVPILNRPSERSHLRRGTTEMLQKKILVPLCSNGKGLKSVHYALSLAKRLQAHVYIIQEVTGKGLANPLYGWRGEALVDLINSAREAGLTISHLLVHRDMENEIVDLVRQEGIDVLVFDEDNGSGERLLPQLKPLFSSQIIQVKEKDHVDYL